jgi:acetyltransferase-like isoleucine patch superfamily enzyme
MVSLADKTLVAAGSVVTRSAEPGAILAGNPAKVIGNRLKPKDPEQAQSSDHEQ